LRNEAGFSGFSKKTLTFLSTNHNKNSKQWFEEHRQEYQEYVLTPFRAFSDALVPIISQIDSEIEVRSHRTVARIYRDTRFSKDKSLYKKALWITFKRTIESWPDFPAFFFELGPGSYTYGLGFYQASRDTLDKIRIILAQKPKLLMNQLSVLKKLPGFRIEGEEYKRALNHAISEKYLSLYQKKNIYFVKTSTVNDKVFSEAILAEVYDSFGTLGTLYDFLATICVKGIDEVARMAVK